MKSIVAGALLPLVLLAVGRVEAQTPRPRSTSVTFGSLPMHFEPNLGQAAGPARFVARGHGYALLLGPEEAVLVFGDERGRGTLRMSLAGVTRTPPVTGVDELPGRTHYLLGNERAKWRTNVPTYGKVKYSAVYPGIDLVYYGNQADLEYDFIVAPHADPQAIRLRFAGTETIRIDADGALVLKTATREMRMRAPVTYQASARGQREVVSRFVLRADGQVGFEIGDYDRARTLVIDPVLAYATYLGGSGDERARAIAVDSAGHVYVAGHTTSLDFPTTAGAVDPTSVPSDQQEAFITKLNAAGTIVYSTYLGGGRDDQIQGIAVDASGAAYATGSTLSTDFPTVNALQPVYGGTSVFDLSFGDAFVTKLEADGSAIVYSTYIGGADAERGYGIAVDAAGRAYVAGRTASRNFPLANAFDPTFTGAFVFALSPSGSAFVYSTFFGGSSGECDPTSIAADATGTAYVGGTAGPAFPTTPDAIQPAAVGNDGFLARFNVVGMLTYSTFIGGTGRDEVNGAAVDAAGFIYLTGRTTSLDFPRVNAVQAARGGGAPDAFIAKLNPAGSAFVYSTYLGGAGRDWGNAIAADSTGNAYVTGVAESPDFPTSDAFQPIHGGAEDVFVAQLSPTGSSLVFSTYLGGAATENAMGIAVDGAGDAYVSGYTTGEDFPTANPLRRALLGTTDAFVARLTRLPLPALSAVEPATAEQGAAIRLTLSGLNFVPGATDVTIGPGVSVSGVDVASLTSLTANVTVAVDAPLGLADVTVTTPEGTSNRHPVTIYSSRPGCRLSLPVAVDGTPLDPFAHFGIGALDPTDGTWVLLLVIYDPSSGSVTLSGSPLRLGQIPQIHPPVMERTSLTVAPPVLAVINAFFNPSLCAFNVALTPSVDPAEEQRLRDVMTGLLGQLSLP